MKKILKLIEEKKGEKTLIYDAEESPLAVDYIILTSADNARKLRAIASNLEKNLKVKPLAVEGSNNSAWIVMDYGDFIIHIFEEATRLFYDLEGLFGEPLWPKKD
ncbi:ribosome silencing factor [Candidatus Acetothermia bacterium]|nr:ribosome silencing factor [Candidatus Acetothermia bacterium]MBI3642708.1 ribosome silencing factor [Candidatus Acetothermia bacterium]